MPIAQGERVLLSYPSANRDAAVFADPMRFDITRPDADKLISFGLGVHYCLGSQFARREVRTLLAEGARAGRHDRARRRARSGPRPTSSAASSTSPSATPSPDPHILRGPDRTHQGSFLRTFVTALKPEVIHRSVRDPTAGSMPTWRANAAPS